MGSPKAVAVNIVFTLSVMNMILVQGFECEKLPVEFCAFAVSSSGERCVLENKYTSTSTSTQYDCQSSGIKADQIIEWIESKECMDYCGLSRMSVGMSSDDLTTNRHFTSKLCSDSCLNSCPNIMELYFNLAAGEGLYLPKFCDTINKQEYGADAPWASLSLSHAADAPLSSFSQVADAPLSSLSLSHEVDAPWPSLSVSYEALSLTSS